MRSLEIPLSNCEVFLTLTWSENCARTSREYRKANVETAVVRINNPADTTFKITDIKLYVPAVTLSTQDDNFFDTPIKNKEEGKSEGITFQFSKSAATVTVL